MRTYMYWCEFCEGVAELNHRKHKDNPNYRSMPAESVGNRARWSGGRQLRRKDAVEWRQNVSRR